jgi:hypothetical protein
VQELLNKEAMPNSEDYIQTLGVNFMEKTISIRNTEITFSVSFPPNRDGPGMVQESGETPCTVF